MLSYGNWCGWAVRWSGITHATLPTNQGHRKGLAVPRICAAPPFPTPASQWAKEAALPTSELEVQILFLLSAAPVLVPDGREPTVGASTRTLDMQGATAAEMARLPQVGRGFSTPIVAIFCDGGSSRASWLASRASLPETLSSQALWKREVGRGANAMRVSAVSQRSAFNLSRHPLHVA